MLSAGAHISAPLNIYSHANNGYANMELGNCADVWMGFKNTSNGNFASLINFFKESLEFTAPLKINV